MPDEFNKFDFQGFHLKPAEEGKPVQFYDGIQEVNFSNAIARIELFRIVGRAEDKKEIRQVQDVIVMPTVALIEFCSSILKFAAASNVKEEFAKELREKLSKALDDVAGASK